VGRAASARAAVQRRRPAGLGTSGGRTSATCERSNEASVVRAARAIRRRSPSLEARQCILLGARVEAA